MAGQTNVTLAINNVQSTNLGNYSVVVTNLYGAVTSSPALLAWDQVPAATPDTVQRFAGGGVRVWTGQLLANDTDADGDGLTVTAVSPSSGAGGTVTLSGNWIYYAPPVSLNGDDAFAYTVSDGHCGGEALGVVTVQVRADDTPVSRLASGVGGDGTFRVWLDGKPGTTYRLQSADNLGTTNWQDVTTGTADSFGTIEYVLAPPTNGPARFYRAVSP